MLPTMEILAGQIVVVGNFNPAIFNAGWLLRNELIGSADADFAISNEGLVLTPDVSRFETEWFSIQVLAEQFVLNSKGALTPAFRDLAVGIFILLSHTPVSALGINTICHFKMASTEEYHKVGDVLAPKDIWHKFYPDSDNQSVGLESMMILVNPVGRDKPLPTYPRQRRITIGTSDLLRANGIRFVLNDHFEIPPTGKDGPTSSEALVSLLRDHWQSCVDSASSDARGIISATLE